MTEQPVKCIVKGCLNYCDGGTFIGVLCSPCHHMISTGEVHSKNPTFIGDLSRLATAMQMRLGHRGFTASGPEAD